MRVRCRALVAASALLMLAALCNAGASAFAGDAVGPVRSIMEMRRQNVVLQQWELSCAAAALATVLRYQHGVPVTERSVALGLIEREAYLANPDLVRLRQGFSLLDLKRFVDQLGYDGVGLGQVSFADLLELAPIIVPVRVRGYAHFVVFRGATQSEVLLADPAFGNVTMSVETFTRAWIRYRDLGQVGFYVAKSGQVAPPGRLAARPADFVLLR